MIMLTGAAGFIGSNVLAALNSQGRDDVICVDDLTNGAKCRNLAGRKFWQYLDYQEIWDKELPEVDVVVHLGANVDTACTDGAAMVRDNYRYSLRLYEEFCADADDCPLVYASSAAVYGSDARHATNYSETPEDENPASPYAVSKWMFDEYVRSVLVDTEFTQITGLRLFNVYGPNEQHKGRMRSAIGNMFNDINEGRRPVLFDGSEYIQRDFVWVGDVVKTVLWAIERRPRGIYNVGTGVARSFLDAFHAVAAAAAYDGHPQYVDFPKDLPHYQHFTKANLTNLREAGYAESFTALEDGVKQYANDLQL